MYECGSRSILITANDTDIVVIATTFCALYQDHLLWVLFGTGKSKRCLPVHEIANQIGSARCKGLPFDHALTGCDTVSCFFEIGKKTAWDAWNAFSVITDTFSRLSNPIDHLSDTDLQLIEAFVVKL